MKKLTTLCCIAFSLLLSACATPTKMGFNQKTEKLDTTSESVFLLSVEMKNELKPDYQPSPWILYIEKDGETTTASKLNFIADEEGVFNRDGGNGYLYRFTLKPGKYKLIANAGKYQSLFLLGQFFMPVHQEIEVTPGKVVYLGHISGKIRQRVNKEFRAGPVIPLIPQSVAGAADGTFDVVISDQYDTDLAQFTEKFPVLKNTVVTKQILPPFNREVAQQWWDAH
ncbi:hypothetical protein HQ393_13990 [Chitinibacter bivalviorum]|uniref:DUF2846 domain-containing protein n=1 Tax=Chitinibacter bivalviorum TaxID=2739434 RepID=A0A7H9BPI8_9NEIS|nr:hypothetical protein [Chitinibacter bivalviorum]QLG89264.1 hypothetical protein HQ393_13990 [Chitinibacter bivalviorum]